MTAQRKQTASTAAQTPKQQTIMHKNYKFKATDDKIWFSANGQEMELDYSTAASICNAISEVMLEKRKPRLRKQNYFFWLTRLSHNSNITIPTDEAESLRQYLANICPYLKRKIGTPRGLAPLSASTADTERSIMAASRIRSEPQEAPKDNHKITTYPPQHGTETSKNKQDGTESLNHSEATVDSGQDFNDKLNALRKKFNKG